MRPLYCPALVPDMLGLFPTLQIHQRSQSVVMEYMCPTCEGAGVNVKV
jgi:hypothetical protein